MKFENREAVLKTARQHAKIDTQYDTEHQKYAIVPFRETATGSFRRCAAFIERIVSVDREKAHTTLLAYDGDSYFWWCGDSFLAGKYSASERNEALKVAKTSAEEHRMMELYGQYKDDPCGFWKHGGEHCKHTDNMAANITGAVLDQLEQLFSGTTPKKSGRRTPRQFIEKRLFKKHVKLEGPKGSGKTFLARQIAEEHADVVINIAGSEEVDSSKMLGHLVPYVERIPKKGQANLFGGNEQAIQTFVFKYGPLARGFRAARAGKKAIIIIDEMYRIPPKQMEILVSALSPFKGEYILPVSNMLESEEEWEDGLVEEEIHAPVDNLMVIATTNVGAKYMVGSINEALQDRFHTKLVPEDRELMIVLTAEAIKERSFPPHLKENLVKFYDGMKRLELDKKLQRDINMRHMVEIVKTAVDPDDIPETIYEMHTQWASLTADGLYDEREVVLIEKVIAAAF